MSSTASHPLHDLSELVSPIRVGLIFLSAGLLGQIYGSLVAGRWGLGYALMPRVVIYAATALRLATVPEGTRGVPSNGSMWEGYRPIFTLLGVRWRGWPDCSRQRSISRSKRYSHYLAEFGHGSCGWPSSKKRRHPGIAYPFCASNWHARRSCSTPGRTPSTAKSHKTSSCQTRIPN